MNAAEAILGWNTVPLVGLPYLDTVYNNENRDHAYVAGNQGDDEITANLFHELVHAKLAQGGLTPEEQNHGAPGVDQMTKMAEVEARANFYLQ